jgi:hypothetical protein
VVQRKSWRCLAACARTDEFYARESSVLTDAYAHILTDGMDHYSAVKYYITWTKGLVPGNYVFVESLFQVFRA